MPRTSRIAERRAALLPVVARTFAELGYRRATTAQLAERCGVQETILYRLWPDKRRMFIASIEYVYALTELTWRRLLDAPDAETAPAAARILDYEAVHLGEFGHYRIVFAGLNETDDPEIRAALRRMYTRFAELIHARLPGAARRASRAPATGALLAWAVIGLGTVANITRELGLLSADERRRLLTEIGHRLLE